MKFLALVFPPTAKICNKTTLRATSPLQRRYKKASHKDKQAAQTPITAMLHRGYPVADEINN
jgi:hypothetical protein